MRCCRGSLALAASLALALFTFPAVAGVSAGVDGSSGVRLEASLTGAAEVPPGDPDIVDMDPIEADVFLNARKETVCFEIDLEEDQDDVLDAVVGAHIHAGPAGVADEDRVLIDLDFANQGLVGCVRAGGELLQSILEEIDDIEVEDPKAPKVSNFYLHLHTSGFPAGGVRGQLEER